MQSRKLRVEGDYSDCVWVTLITGWLQNDREGGMKNNDGSTMSACRW